MQCMGMKTRVTRDARGEVVWSKGCTNLSPLTYLQALEMNGQKAPCSVTNKDGKTFYAPFTETIEEVG